MKVEWGRERAEWGRERRRGRRHRDGRDGVSRVRIIRDKDKGT